MASAGFVVFVKEGGKSSAPYNLEVGEEYTIGSSIDCHIRFKFSHPLLQDTHALLHVNQDGVATLTNKSNQQTIKVNDEPLVKSVVLNHEDTFDILGKVFQYFNKDIIKVAKAQQSTNTLIKQRKSIHPLLKTTHKTSPPRKCSKLPSFVTPTRTKISPRCKTESKVSKTVALPRNAKKRRFSLGTFKSNIRACPEVSTSNLQLSKSLTISEIDELVPSTSSGIHEQLTPKQVKCTPSVRRTSKAHDVLVTMSPDTLPTKGENRSPLTRKKISITPRKSLLKMSSATTERLPLNDKTLRRNNGDSKPQFAVDRKISNTKRISFSTSTKSLNKNDSRTSALRRNTINIVTDKNTSPKNINRALKLLPRRSIRSVSATSSIRKHSPNKSPRNISRSSKRLNDEKQDEGNASIDHSLLLPESHKSTKSPRKSLLKIREDASQILHNEGHLDVFSKKSPQRNIHNDGHNVSISSNKSSVEVRVETKGRQTDTYIACDLSSDSMPELQLSTSDNEQKDSLIEKSMAESPNVKDVKTPRISLKQNIGQEEEYNNTTNLLNISKKSDVSLENHNVKQSPSTLARKSSRINASLDMNDDSRNGDWLANSSASESATKQVKVSVAESPSTRISVRNSHVKEHTLSTDSSLNNKSLNESIYNSSKRSSRRHFSPTIKPENSEQSTEDTSKSTRKSLRRNSSQIGVKDSVNEDDSTVLNVSNQSNKSKSQQNTEVDNESGSESTRKSLRFSSSFILKQESRGETVDTSIKNQEMESAYDYLNGESSNSNIRSQTRNSTTERITESPGKYARKSHIKPNSSVIKEQEEMDEHLTENVSNLQNVNIPKKSLYISVKQDSSLNNTNIEESFPRTTRKSLRYNHQQNIKDEVLNESFSNSLISQTKISLINQENQKMEETFTIESANKPISQSSRNSSEFNSSHIQEQKSINEQNEDAADVPDDSTPKDILMNSSRKSLRYNSYLGTQSFEDSNQIPEKVSINEASHECDLSSHNVTGRYRKSTIQKGKEDSHHNISKKFTRKSLRHSASLGIKQESSIEQITETVSNSQNVSCASTKKSINDESLNMTSRSSKKSIKQNVSIDRQEESVIEVFEDFTIKSILVQSSNELSIKDQNEHEPSLPTNNSLRKSRQSSGDILQNEHKTVNTGESFLEKSPLKSSDITNKSKRKSLKATSVNQDNEKPPSDNNEKSVKKSVRNSHIQYDETILDVSTDKSANEFLQNGLGVINRSLKSKKSITISTYKEDSMIVNISSTFKESPASPNLTSPIEAIKKNSLINSQEETLNLSKSETKNTGNAKEPSLIQASIFDESTEVMPSPVQRISSRRSIRTANMKANVSENIQNSTNGEGSTKKNRKSNYGNDSSLNSLYVNQRSGSIISISSQSFSSFKKNELNNDTEREIDILSTTCTPNKNSKILSHISIKKENRRSTITRTPRPNTAIFNDVLCTSTPFCKPTTSNSNISTLNSPDSRTESKKLEVITVSSESAISLSTDSSMKRRSSLRVRSISRDKSISCRPSNISDISKRLNQSINATTDCLDATGDTPILHRTSRAVSLSETPKKYSQMEDETPKSVIKSNRLSSKSNNSIYKPLTEDITPVTPEKLIISEYNEESFKTPINTPGLFESIKESAIRSRKRPRETNGSFIKDAKKPKIDTSIKTTDEKSTPKRNQKKQKSPKNDLTNVPNLRPLMSPKRNKSPKNDLRDVAGVKRIFEKNTPLNDLTEVPNLKQLELQSPKNDLTNVVGVKRIFQKNSPYNDLSNVPNLKRLVSSKSNTTNNDLTNVSGVKNVFRKSTANDLRHIPNLRKFVSPKIQKSPQNDLANVSGIANMFNLSGVAVLHQGSDIENTEDMFSKLTGQKPLRSYRGRSLSPKKDSVSVNLRKTVGDIPVCSPRVQQWINEQTNVVNQDKEKLLVQDKDILSKMPTKPNRTRKGRTISPKKTVTKSDPRRKSQGDNTVPNVTKWKSEPPQLIPLQQSKVKTSLKASAKYQKNSPRKSGGNKKKVAFADELLLGQESNVDKQKNMTKKRPNCIEQNEMSAKKIKLDESKPSENAIEEFSGKNQLKGNKRVVSKSDKSETGEIEHTQELKKNMRSTTRSNDLAEVISSPVRKSSRSRKVKSPINLQTVSNPNVNNDVQSPPAKKSRNNTKKLSKAEIEEGTLMSQDVEAPVATADKKGKISKKNTEPEATESLITSQEVEEVTTSLEIEKSPLQGGKKPGFIHSTPKASKSLVIEINKPISRRGLRTRRNDMDDQMPESLVVVLETKTFKKGNKKINEVSDLSQIQSSPLKRSNRRKKVEVVEATEASPVVEIKKSGRTKVVTKASDVVDSENELSLPKKVGRTTRRIKDVTKESSPVDSPLENKATESIPQKRGGRTTRRPKTDLEHINIIPVPVIKVDTADAAETTESVLPKRNGRRAKKAKEVDTVLIEELEESRSGKKLELDSTDTQTDQMETKRGRNLKKPKQLENTKSALEIKPLKKTGKKVVETEVENYIEGQKRKKDNKQVSTSSRSLEINEIGGIETDEVASQNKSKTKRALKVPETGKDVNCTNESEDSDEKCKKTITRSTRSRKETDNNENDDKHSTQEVKDPISSPVKKTATRSRRAKNEKIVNTEKVSDAVPKVISQNGKKQIEKGDIKDDDVPVTRVGRKKQVDEHNTDEEKNIKSTKLPDKETINTRSLRKRK